MIGQRPEAGPPGSVGRVSDTSVVNVPEKHRYEISLDGVPAGLTAYVDREGQRIFFHTEVADQFEGQGVGSSLVRAALEDTRAAGLRIVPVCPYVAKWVGKHHEFDDVLDAVTDEALEAVRATAG